MSAPDQNQPLQQQQAAPVAPVVAAPAPVAAAPVPQQQQQPAGDDNLACQWDKCSERCTSAEQLFEHICEKHVGRKSTNNLNLTCGWNQCRTTTVKRDHITSHIRVHVPLKPHKCDFCGKAFKRPQDLKKHVKTHADDSVLLRSPEPSRAQHGGGGSYSSNNGKPSGLYPDNGFGSNGAYGAHSAATNGGGYYSSAPQNSAYGPVYYAQPNALATDSYEMRKRATYDALNEFFGDVKKRQIDPSVYYDVGQRLMGIQGVQLPMLSGGYHGGNDYSGGPGVTTAHAPVHQNQYQLPLPNLRTKNDLVNIDQFLEALQSTVYENPNQAAAAGVQQAGAHYLHPQVGYRSSNSPPGSTHGHIGSSHASAMASMSAPATDTPALTPASSVLSYTSGHSPGSVGSGNTISPTTRSNMGSMYPTLPSVSAMDVSGNYTATSNAPSSSLGTSFDAEGRRRYSGPLLQKARRGSDQMDLSEDSLSPKEDSRRGSVDTTRLTAVDPALGGLKSPGSSSSHDVADRDQETWVENIRTIEQLREYIKHRLEQGDFTDEDEEMKDDKSAMDDAQSLYPVLRAVQDG